MALASIKSFQFPPLFVNDSNTAEESVMGNYRHVQVEMYYYMHRYVSVFSFSLSPCANFLIFSEATTMTTKLNNVLLCNFFLSLIIQTACTLYDCVIFAKNKPTTSL